MYRTLALLFLIAVLATAGCAHSLSAAKETAPPNASAQADAEFRQKVIERMNEEEGIFGALAQKMDAYQNLLAICDLIPEGAEDSEMKASCTSRLKAMRQELSELSELLRDEPKGSPGP